MLRACAQGHNPFASQQSNAFSTDRPLVSPAVTAIPQPSLLPSSRADSTVCNQVSLPLALSPMPGYLHI